jgi:hypothetical protein
MCRWAARQPARLGTLAKQLGLAPVGLVLLVLAAQREPCWCHGIRLREAAGGPLASPLPAMRCCTECMTRERMRWETHFGGRRVGDLTSECVQ